MKEKKISSIKSILINKGYNDNFIITLNNENILQIINIKTFQKSLKKKKANLKHNKFLISVPLDEKVEFYDMENDIKKHLKIEQSNSKKYVLVRVKQNEDYSQSYIFQLINNKYNRLKKSILSKNCQIKKGNFFGEESEDKSGKIELEDIANLKDDTKDRKSKDSNVFNFDENDSEKNSQKKKEKDLIEKEISKAKLRKGIKQLTFGIFNKDNLNESDNDEENEDEDKKKDNKDFSEEDNSSEEEKEEEENEDEDEKGKDESDELEEEKEEKDDKDEDKDSEEDEDNDSDEKSDKNKNKKENNISDIKDEKDSEGKNDSKSNKSSEDFFINKNNNEEEINTDMDKNKKDNKNSIDDKDSSEKEDGKSNSS